SDQGMNRFRFSLVPHQGGWAEANITRRAAAFNQPPLVSTGSSVTADGTTAELAVEASSGSVAVQLRRTTSGQTLIRLVEETGTGATVSLSGLEPETPVWSADIVERPETLVGSGPDLSLELGAFEVLNLLIGDGAD
ncbi:MAG: hypothetical protein KDB69_01815, partial [Acidimicrobiia bacterium]|nr:hypothetical protein [Acidimicrobiia bacterium]